MSEAGRHEAPDEPEPDRGLLGDLHDAIAPRTVGLVVGVLLLQLGFILSYVGAFHAPAPHRIPVAVVAPQQRAAQLVDRLNRLPGDPLHAHPAVDEDAARARIRDGSASAALLVNPTGTEDTLLVASGGGTSVATSVEEVTKRIESGQHRTASVRDILPLQVGDGRGLTGFYLVIGWIVGGYLVAALLGVAKGARPTTVRRAGVRLAALVPYAVLSGLGGALIVDQILGALTGHFLALWWLGALLVFGAAAVTMAFQVLFGVVGIGLTVLVFVVLGNPSAGGAYQAALLPPFWRALSGALPNGAGTDSVRRIVYFGAHGITGHLVVLAIYAVGGAAVTVTASVINHRRSTAAEQRARPQAA